MKVVALAGGVGGARFLGGLVQVVDPVELTVVANTGDDVRLHGLHVSPDLDSITYTLGAGADPDRGWGRADETYVVATELRERYSQPSWFTLGDRDFATHILRSRLLAEGVPLSEVTAEITRAWGLPFRLLPMTDDRVETRIATADGRELHFQEWWVRESGRPHVARVWLHGARDAEPAPGVMEAIAAADAVLLCPSNPIVSIGTILAVPGVRAALLAAPAVVGVSPIVGGRVVRGMADRLLPAVGADVSAAGVARLYTDFLDGWVIDDIDAGLASEVAARDVRVRVTDTMMRTPSVAAALARTALDLAEEVQG